LATKTALQKGKCEYLEGGIGYSKTSTDYIRDA